MQRRLVLLLGLGATSLAACANRRPKQDLKPNDLRRIGMLPLKEWPYSGSTAQFNRTLNPAEKDGVIPPPLSPSLIGMAIGSAIRNSRNADAAALADAVAWAKFEPEPTLRRALQRELARRGVEVEALDDPALAERVRRDRLKDLPTNVDAILDVQILSAGYYDIGKNAGFSPYFSLRARLVDAVNPGEIVEEFSYGAHHEASGGDARHFTTPPELTQPSLMAFQGHADAIRTGLTTLVDRVAVKLADDLVRVRDRQPRLE